MTPGALLDFARALLRAVALGMGSLGIAALWGSFADPLLTLLPDVA